MVGMPLQATVFTPGGNAAGAQLLMPLLVHDQQNRNWIWKDAHVALLQRHF